MPISAVLSYAAAYISLMMAAAVLVSNRHLFIQRVFAAGMFLFAGEELLRGFSYGAILPADIIYWQQRAVLVSLLIPSVWLAFSLSYARANSRMLLSRWKWALMATAAGPVAFTMIFWRAILSGTVYLTDSMHWEIGLGWAGNALSLFDLVVSVLIVSNIERTVRSSIGRMRWQIKFMALGVGGLFGVRIYLASQSLLYSSLNTGLLTISAFGLIAANLLFAFSLARGRSLDVDVYLSAATIQNSLTIILVGGYLVAVGLLAKVARYVDPNLSLPLDAFFVFLSLTVLGVLLLSNRLRRQFRLFVSRNFRRPLYDYRKVWMDLTRRTTSLMDAGELSTAVSKMVSESLEILSVSVWLVDESQRRLSLSGSTALSRHCAHEVEKAAAASAPEFIRFLGEQQGCIDLDDFALAWPAQIMAAAPEFFGEWKMRYAIGLQTGGELVGVMTLNDDRVGGGRTLFPEDIVLLETLAAQLASCLLNLRLSSRLRHAKEVETFQTVSTFFVHDLKNLASRLSLTMQNLPANFDNPEFRAEALRIISTSVTKIDDMCERLAMLRQKIELRLDPCDLAQLVGATLDEFKGTLKAQLQQDLQQVPPALIDREQIHKVLTNLVMNANEAVNGNGVIQVSTLHEGNMVGFAVKDNGCGMSEEFLQRSLFKPFQTTKKKGLGIGLFHSKLIVEAHRGAVEVNSTAGVGTEFRIVLPIG